MVGLCLDVDVVAGCGMKMELDDLRFWYTLRVAFSLLTVCLVSFNFASHDSVMERDRYVVLTCHWVRYLLYAPVISPAKSQFRWNKDAELRLLGIASRISILLSS